MNLMRQKCLLIHADFCPVARTIRDCVEISTSLEIESE